VDFGRAGTIEYGFSLTGADVGAALVARAAYTTRVNEFMNDYNLLVTPTLPGLPFEAGIDNPPEVAGVPTPQLHWTPFTYGVNLTNAPAASVPAGLSTSGLP